MKNYKLCNRFHLFKVTRVLTMLSFFLSCFLSWAMAGPIEKPHFYKVSKGAEFHYILGTFHLGIHWDDFPYRVKKAFNSAKNIILEIEFSENSRSSLSLSLDTMAPATTTLSETQKNKLRKLGISDKLFPESSEEDCLLFLYSPFVGKYPFYMLDKDIYFKAKDSQKNIYYLDTPEILRNSKIKGRFPSNECTVGLLLKHLSIQEILNIGRTIIINYKNGPKKYLYKEDLSVNYRNQAWMPQILQTFRLDNSFLAIGVAHLYGEKGLIKLLRDQGYLVQIEDK